ncbi:major facilitator superfamily domain-containing protein [Macrophomina phaseolina]|uniref:Major facilitator superfamily domain-containing protein n=1 Tax=Macrophomina phaseolina TaxID=35725 RepID=A0ABQ8G1I8_9PEZI|nr:major facilitator superfamily domain-containing protein [Macrophomina phaseolina]
MAANKSLSIRENVYRFGRRKQAKRRPAGADEFQYDFDESNGALRHVNKLGTDIVYQKKVALLNEAILDIGMGHYQWWTFLLTGFGCPFVQREFSVERIAFLTVAEYTGMVIGATVMPITADFVGRRPAFNVSFGMSSLFGLIAAGVPNFLGVATMSAFIGVTTGENREIDSCVFLEFIPASHQYLLTMQTAFFALAQAVSVLIAWPFVGRESEAVRVIQKVAARNGTETWLTLGHFHPSPSANAAAERLKSTIRQRLSKFQPRKLAALFATPKMAASTSLIVLLWLLIGLAFPLTDATFRTYCIQAACVRRIGRKGTGALASVLSGVFLFLYTRAETPAAVTGFSCAIAFFQNMALALFYSYSPELFPAPVHGTGNGLTAMFNRLGGLMAPIIAAYVGVTNTPIWVSAALFIAIGFVFALLPYETRRKAAS